MLWLFLAVVWLLLHHRLDSAAERDIIMHVGGLVQLSPKKKKRKRNREEIERKLFSSLSECVDESKGRKETWQWLNDWGSGRIKPHQVPIKHGFRESTISTRARAHTAITL